MSVWTGWQGDLLKGAGFPNNPTNRAFLTAWHQHAQSNCAQNPVDISKQVTGSSNCYHLNQGRTAQNYPGPGAAVAAFKGQINGPEFIDLNAGFRNSSLTAVAASASVIGELRIWGSVGFADYLQGGGVAGGGGSATSIHKGWHDIRRSLNRKSPRALSATDRATAAALRKLRRAHRVKL